MSNLQNPAEKEAEMLSIKINEILTAIAKLADSNEVIAFLGDKTRGIVANEYAAVKHILTVTTKSNDDRSKQILKIKCTPESWTDVVLSAIQIGLTLNPYSKQCAVIPYGNQITLDIMVAGYKHLLFANNIVKKIDTNAICKNDEFSMIQPLLKDTVSTNFKFVKAMEDRGEYIGGFCFFVLLNGEYLGDYLPRVEIEKRRKVAETQTAWNEWELEMVETTVLKYVMKNLPAFTSLPIFGQIAQIDEQHIELEKLVSFKAIAGTAKEKPIMDLMHPNFLACRAAVLRGDNTIENLRGGYEISDESALDLTLPEMSPEHENWSKSMLCIQSGVTTIKRERQDYFITQANALKLINDAI